LRSAAIYVLKDRVLLHPWQTTTDGVGIASEPYIAVPKDADSFYLGEVLLSVLSASGQTVPHPKDWAGLSRPRLHAAGVKSEAAFHSGTLSTSVTWQGETLSFIPTSNGGGSGPKMGFYPLPESSSSVAAGAGAGAIGTALRSALKCCR
jgi:hypothetical protein